MKTTYKIKLSQKEYDEYVEMLKSRGFKQIGTRLFEDNQSYIKIKIEENLKIYKVFKANHDILAYVKVNEGCTIFDTSYAALQLVRKLLNDSNVNGTQLLDENEPIMTRVPIYTID
nr:MAG TPA: hypothetical protein [Bacteriophage sp.]